MPHIEELRRQRAGINEQVQALATIDASGGTLTAEQLKEFANLQQQFTDISAKIERLEAAERAAALVAKPVKATQQAPGIIVKQEPKQYTGAGITRLVMSVAAGAGNLQDAAKFASEELNDQSVSMAISTAAASGGVLIPQNLHSEVIELLSDRTIVRKLGARPVPLPNGNMTLPRVAGGATASYTGENKDAKTSETRFDDVKLTAKTLIAMVPISNALIGRAGFNVEQLVLQDILTAISVREDKAFMRDDGNLYAIKSVDSDTQLTLTRNITTAFSGASYGIITAETASTSSFANQLASAFAFWRSVVEGWSMALTGSSNITLTDPITGKQVTVPAIGGMAKASDLNALAKLTGGNKLDGSQVITSDNAGFILGKNSDLALLKKQGQGGTIAVGSGTPFRVQRSRATTVSPSDTFDDILVIGTDNQTTLPGGLSAGGNIDNTSKGKVLTQAIELSMSTPYIDFHYNGSSADYTARLIHDRQNRLNVQVQSFWVTDGRITASSTMPANPAIGTQLTSSPVRSLMAGRGAYGDVDGAYVQMYMEEQVGTEHRLVLYADGFGRTDAWIFRAGGTISTGKGDVLTTGSDLRLKEDFTESQEGASRRINALGVCEFNMKGETRRRRGFIAQQAEKVDDLYTFPGIEQEIDGEKFRVMNVDYTAIIADLVTVVQDLLRRVDALES